MRNFIGNLRNFGLYLLPFSLLVLCGALLTALLYNPVPPVRPVVALSVPVLASEEYWRAHAEEMFIVLLADALRQSQTMQETQARTLMYRLPSKEAPDGLRTVPLFIENDSRHPLLMRL
ncbi:MAG TPA: hypothetical protein P5149_07025 [Candidatus Competibacteraceae bacterium]|nr:hypothetical protein [Candidatus Competibacteraceae bacterium]MCP5133382.1 hypothetical protein [Gammaproteobacteria bacterium]HPF57226.1 hypothetical protein [Candidatus Competibacteraceae bacterium]HRY18144.1 hypothetical protein [Candidatus Competibacteraceae bacterium]